LGIKLIDDACEPGSYKGTCIGIKGVIRDLRYVRNLLNKNYKIAHNLSSLI